MSTRSSTMNSSSTALHKARQLSHLQAQLALLTAHTADLENLLRMTSVQAESIRGLGGYAGAMFMAASKILGEETVNPAAATAAAAAAGHAASTADAESKGGARRESKAGEDSDE